MIKVKVNNFQSIEEAQVDIDGFTVVTGKNNSGKSALLRALNCVFTNALGSSFVRSGTSNCRVFVEFEDGTSVAWEKGEKVKPTYWINGGDPIHCGRNAPKELEQFGVGPLKVASRELWPQIAPQFTGQVFLIDLPSSVTAEVVADVDRVGELNGALKNCEKDKRAKRYKLKIRSEDLAELVDDLNEFQYLDSQVVLLEEINQQKVRLNDLQDKISNLERLTRLHKEYSKQINSLSGVESLTLPPTDKIKSIRSDLKPLRSLSQRKTACLSTMSNLRGVDTLSVLDVDSIVPIMRTLKEYRGIKKRKEKVVSQIKALSLVLENPVDEVTPPNLDDLIKIKQLKDTYVKHKNSVCNTEALIKQKEKEVFSVEKQISDCLLENGGCPICGSLDGHI